MDSEFWKELVGYAGMVFLIISFLMKDIKKLRIFNIIGGSICAIYGFITATYATAVINIMIIIINISYPVRYIINENKNNKKQN